MSNVIARILLAGLIALTSVVPASYAAATGEPSGSIVIDTGSQRPSNTTKIANHANAPKEIAPKGKSVVAHVVWVKGTFYATQPGSTDKRTLQSSSNVYMNDTLVTGDNSEAEVVYSDNSNMTFRPNTSFYISEYNYVPKTPKEGKSVGRYVVDLLEGGFRTITGLIAKDHPDDYQVNTPVATIGVRGTEFSVVVDRDGKVFVKRYKGLPCVTNKSNDKRKQTTLCMDQTTPQFIEVQSPENPPLPVAIQPTDFTVDVEVVPVVYNNGSPGFCGMSGCQNAPASGFCVQ